MSDLHKKSLACRMGCILRTGNTQAYSDFVDYGECKKSISGTHVFDTNSDRVDTYVCCFCGWPDSEYWKIEAYHSPLVYTPERPSPHVKHQSTFRHSLG